MVKSNARNWIDQIQVAGFSLLVVRNYAQPHLHPAQIHQPPTDEQELDQDAAQASCSPLQRPSQKDAIHRKKDERCRFTLRRPSRL